VLLPQAMIPSLDEAIAAMIHEENSMNLHSEARRDVGMPSALIVSNSDIKWFREKTQKCYNYGKVRHLSKVCPKPPTERETIGRGQTRSRGGRRDGRKGYQANLTVGEKEEARVVFTEDDKILFEILRRKQIATSDGIRRV
jgi:hypothetical protein